MPFISHDAVQQSISNIHTFGIRGYGTHGEKFIYVLGIIDLLQEWTLQKRGERFVKTVFKGHDGDSVSAVEPSVYSSRFLESLDARLQ